MDHYLASIAAALLAVAASFFVGDVPAPAMSTVESQTVTIAFGESHTASGSVGSLAP